MRFCRRWVVLLCAVVLLTGCGTAVGDPTAGLDPVSGEEQGGGGTSDLPQSELEQLDRQVQAWETEGTFDEDAYRQAILTAVELARKEDRMAYRCSDPDQLEEEKLAALTDAAMRCHCIFGIY